MGELYPGILMVLGGVLLLAYIATVVASDTNPSNTEMEAINLLALISGPILIIVGTITIAAVSLGL